ncbi:vomeronasal type-2 receptor 26-like [Bombina bombina]|uniref:vomeronasal type-2 receptor 26-like n=1 Tax=Bombina bombina TaxID=8345 RepID=UPI00235AEBC5|nr:vomeronasal type-2 receptor 26-like [Bombina bombina]
MSPSSSDSDSEDPESNPGHGMGRKVERHEVDNLQLLGKENIIERSASECSFSSAKGSLQYPEAIEDTSTACQLESTTLENYNRNGDFIIGAIMMLYSFSVLTKNKFDEKPIPNTCVGPSLRYYRHLLAVVFAVEEINRNPLLLPNITLGIEMIDSCMFEYRSLQSTLQILTGNQKNIPKYQCRTKGILAGFIGHLLSSSTYSIAGLTGIYRYPQISYGAQDQILDDLTLFPSFYQTIPNENTQYKGIIKLLLHFGWTWVGLIATNDESNLRASEQLKSEMIKSGICVEFFEKFSSNGFIIDLLNVVNVIKKSSANVILLFCDYFSFYDMIYTAQIFSVPAKVWITSTSLSLSADDMSASYLTVFNGSLLISIHKGNIPGLKDFLYTVTPYTYPDDIITARMWRLTFGCLPVNHSMFNSSTFGLTRNCTGKETLKVFGPAYDVDTFRLTYAVYKAVYALAYSLHNTLSFMKNKQQSVYESFHASKLNQYLKDLHFNTTSGEEFYFENGRPLAQYDIINWVIVPNKTILRNQIGSFSMSESQGEQLLINRHAINWNQKFNQTPRSVCSKSCPPGYRKALQQSKPICCYDCVPCSDGEISNRADMENCVKCAEDQWSNTERTVCISRTIEFLSYDDILGISLATISIIFAIMTLGVLVIFIFRRDTAIVKANNRNLSYTLLISLTMCFLCSLLFIGRPVALTCFFRQAAFGIIFAVSVSSVLAKTITVVIAFNATKPGSRARKWVGSRITSYLVFLSSLGEALICLLWFLCSPPFPDFDTREKSDKMILQCNEGSVTAFYFVVGYIGLLAALSFIVAFLARKLPDSFNEATYITFSMLLFCSVWVSFFPAYLSTKGKYMVAVEIFAILSSSAGLMGCIFIPKCYIIVIRPDLNTRENLIGKKGNRSIVDSTRTETKDHTLTSTIS